MNWGEQWKIKNRKKIYVSSFIFFPQFYIFSVLTFHSNLDFSVVFELCTRTDVNLKMNRQIKKIKNRKPWKTLLHCEKKNLCFLNYLFGFFFQVTKF
jgi:hypothetical protein